MATNQVVDDNDLEISTLIWLDGSIYETENQQVQEVLRPLSNNFEAFDNVHDCELYIQSSSIHDRLVLIVSGRFGREIVPRICQFKQISSIYIYCMDRKGNIGWAQYFSKIKDVLTTPDELLIRIRLDNEKEIYQINDDLLYINTYMNSSDNQFVHSQLLIDYLLNINIHALFHSHALKLRQSDYNDLDSSSANSIDKLIKHQSLLKLLTHALHTTNFILLYTFHSLIRDINQQLESYKCSTPIHVYCSYSITDEDFEQLKNSVGKLISINTFLVAILQREKVVSALEKIDHSKKILFDISADPSTEDARPFADSICQSQIFFMLGSLFSIENFSQENDIWICQMKLSNGNDINLKQILQQIKAEDGDIEIDPISLGNTLARIGQYNDAEKYYQFLLNELPSDHEDKHIIYRNLGNVAYVKNDYDQSIEYHLKSLEIRKTLFGAYDPNIADSYNCLGIAYFYKNNYKQAIDSYEKSLTILKLLSDNGIERKIAACLNNIGLVYRSDKMYSKALDYYHEVLNLEKTYLSKDHPDLAQTYHNIGTLHWCCGSDDRAMEYYQLSLENKKDPRFVGMTMENIGLLHENKKDFQQALKYYEEAASFYRQNLSSTHFDVIQIEDNIQRVSSHLK